METATEASLPAGNQGPGAQGDTNPDWTPVHAACMEICVDLLNHHIAVHEYEYAFVCVLAVLGRFPYGWCDADSYPPILSWIIRISRLMVLHKAALLEPQSDAIIAYLQDRAS